MLHITCLDGRACSVRRQQCRVAKDVLRHAVELLSLPDGDHNLVAESETQPLDETAEISAEIEHLTLIQSSRPQGWSKWMIEAGKNPLGLRWAPTCIRCDKDVALTAINADPESYRYVSSSLKRDCDIRALYRASQEVRDWMRRVCYAPGHLSRAPEHILHDRRVVLKAVRTCGLSLSFAGPELKQDREVVLSAVRQNGDVLGMLPKNMQRDHDIVLAAVQQDPSSIWYVWEDISIMSNRRIVCCAAEWDGRVLTYAAQHLQDDKEVVLRCLNSWGTSLEFASQKLQEDEDTVLAAVRADGCSLKYASKELLAKPDFCRRAVHEWIATACRRQTAQAAWWATADEAPHCLHDWCIFDTFTAADFVRCDRRISDGYKLTVARRQKDALRHKASAELRKKRTPGTMRKHLRANRLVWCA